MCHFKKGDIELDIICLHLDVQRLKAFLVKFYTQILLDNHLYGMEITLHSKNKLLNMYN